MEDRMQRSRKRAREDDSGEPELELAEVKRLRDDLFGVLDDSDPDTASQDLDSVMRSFQDEISAAPSTSTSSPVAVIDLTSDSDESPSELGYLLEASDDELGLPPSTVASGDKVTELIRVSSDSSGIGELWGFGSFYDQIPSYYYDSFEHGGVREGPDDEYAAFDDRLFGFSDDGGWGFDPYEVSDFFWQSETLPAQ